MFLVIFEVQPRPDQWDAYMSYARMLRPELERIDGFVDNTRYRSLTRAGWILSVSTWRDEKALVRWRTHAQHHLAQERGREEVMLDYHLRVGELTADSRWAHGRTLPQQRLDETQAGTGTALSLTDVRRSVAWLQDQAGQSVAASLGLEPHAPGLVAWDVFDAVLTPGDVILAATWRRATDAHAAARTTAPGEDMRRREVRVVRDYGMFDRREAPQYYPEVAGP